MWKSFLKHLVSKFSILSSEQGLCLTAIAEDGGDKRFVELELACKVGGVASLDPV